MIDGQTPTQVGQPGFDQGGQIPAVLGKIRKQAGEQRLELPPLADDHVRNRRPARCPIPAGTASPHHATIPFLTAKRTSSALLVTRSCSIMRYL